MIPRATPQTLPFPTPNPFAPEEIADFRNGCEGVASRGGELGQLAERMLRVSETMQALNAKIESFLKS